MRKAALVLLGVFLLAVLVSAEEMVTWKIKKLNLADETRVGTVVLPAGDYKLQHEMEGANHIMIFTLMGKETKSFRVACGMQARELKARRDEQHFRIENNQRVLTGLVFAGDNVMHTF